MKNKWTIFLLSFLVLFGFIFLAFVASVYFSIKKATSIESQISGSDNIAVFDIKGIILSSTKITEKIAEMRDKPEVMGVIFRIDSPGGAVGPAQEIYSEILKLKKKKPVYASLGSIATSVSPFSGSGGLVVACIDNEEKRTRIFNRLLVWPFVNLLIYIGIILLGI